MSGHRAAKPRGLFKDGLFWGGLAAATAIAVLVGTQRTRSGPPWWEAGLAVAALMLLAGLVVATIRATPGWRRADVFGCVNLRVFGTSILALMIGLGIVLFGPERNGIVETLEGTCFMYGGVGLPASIVLFVVWVVIGERSGRRGTVDDDVTDEPRGSMIAPRVGLVGGAESEYPLADAETYGADLVERDIAWKERFNWRGEDSAGLGCAVIIVLMLFGSYLVWAIAGYVESDGDNWGYLISIVIFSVLLIIGLRSTLKGSFGGRLPTRAEATRFVADADDSRRRLRAELDKGNTLAAIALRGFTRRYARAVRHNRIRDTPVTSW